MIEVLRAVGIVPGGQNQPGRPGRRAGPRPVRGGTARGGNHLPHPGGGGRYPRGLRRRAGGLRLRRDGIDGAAGRARPVAAGAKAIVSPGTNMEVVDWCLAQGVPVIPGCAHPQRNRGLHA